MKLIRRYRGWGIYQLNNEEQEEHMFAFAPVHPDVMESAGKKEPTDADWECDSLPEAISWIENY